MLVGLVWLGTAAAFAGDGCCAAGGTAKAGANFTANTGFAGLNLTAEQKTKVAAVVAECKTSGCTAAASEKMAAGLKGILTPEQYTQWTAACDQARAAKSGGTCPFAAKAKDAQTESKN